MKSIAVSMVVVSMLLLSSLFIASGYEASGDIEVISYTSEPYDGGWRIEALLRYNSYNVYNVTIIVDDIALTPLEELNITLYHNVTVWHDIEFNAPSIGWSIDLSDLDSGEKLVIKWWEGRYNYWIPPITEVLGRRSFKLCITLGSQYQPSGVEFPKALNITFYIPLEWNETVIDSSRLEAWYLFNIDLMYCKGPWCPQRFYNPVYKLYVNGSMVSARDYTPQFSYGYYFFREPVGKTYNFTVVVERMNSLPNMTIHRVIEYIVKLPPGEGEPSPFMKVNSGYSSGYYTYMVQMEYGWFDNGGTGISDLLYRYYRDTVLEILVRANTTLLLGNGEEFIEETFNLSLGEDGEALLYLRSLEPAEINITLLRAYYNNTITSYNLTKTIHVRDKQPSITILLNNTVVRVNAKPVEVVEDKIKYMIEVERPCNAVVILTIRAPSRNDCIEVPSLNLSGYGEVNITLGNNTVYYDTLLPIALESTTTDTLEIISTATNLTIEVSEVIVNGTTYVVNQAISVATSPSITYYIHRYWLWILLAPFLVLLLLVLVSRGRR